MAGTTAARRYAKALFALSAEQKSTEQVHADLEALVGLMDTSAEWSSFILSPFGSSEKRVQLMDNTLKNRVHPLTLRFLGFIDQKRRISLLPLIQTEWLALYDASKNIIRAKVYTAVPLTESQLTALNAKLSKRFGKTVVLSTGTDTSMIGGMKIHIGDHVFDYSIESQLQHLQKQMTYA